MHSKIIVLPAVDFGQHFTCTLCMLCTSLPKIINFYNIKEQTFLAILQSKCVINWFIQYVLGTKLVNTLQVNTMRLYNLHMKM